MGDGGGGGGGTMFASPRPMDIDVSKFSTVLLDGKRPLPDRYRALFTLRNMGESPKAVEALIAALEGDDGALLRHEVAFALGQMRAETAVSSLEGVLRDSGDDAIVRHEAAEALGAVGLEKCEELLRAYATDAAPEVSETCQLALDRLHVVEGTSSFGSVDPAEALVGVTDPRELLGIVLNDSEQISRRYGALFALRNGRHVPQICTALLEANSALLRHEIAYVLGQLQDEVSVSALQTCLANKTEHSMVRHEAAEALGAVASDACIELLKVYSVDEDPIVADSCKIALDMLERKDEFEYLSV